jgi:hypothetical protein
MPKSERIPLHVLGSPGDVEDWRSSPDPRVMVDDQQAKSIWRHAIAGRIRQRQALHALGYELVERGSPIAEQGHLLGTYTEVWIGDLGTITVEWNHDPTRP